MQSQANAQSAQASAQAEVQKQLRMMPGQEKFLMEYYQKNPSAVASLRGNIYEEKIINSINPFNWIRVARKINNENPDYVIIRYWLPFMAPCLGTISRLLNKLFESYIRTTFPAVCFHFQCKSSSQVS